jgi:hypothetical protein
MKGDTPISMIIIGIVVLLIMIALVYYLYTHLVPSQKTLTGQQCDVLLKTACDAYKKQTQKNPKEAFSGVPEGCVEKEPLNACKGGDTSVCDTICAQEIVGPEEGPEATSPLP